MGCPWTCGLVIAYSWAWLWCPWDRRVTQSIRAFECGLMPSPEWCGLLPMIHSRPMCGLEGRLQVFRPAFDARPKSPSLIKEDSSCNFLLSLSALPFMNCCKLHWFCKLTEFEARLLYTSRNWGAQTTISFPGSKVFFTVYQADIINASELRWLIKP